ncbi:uncharacterized protein ColSpa_05310 [Colletotrichum spaethianum]|uniref:Uncharacterized protein n=1 Tax=Colletotrichum spaethianum TaxID=700344 RepID=A0AA37LD32_9PEZI|nr:uncharacterized protein ColSpa_05310 [Colletotrichum spaethianum]GKT45129.1 hypothetical protein ColSpa_05310 [Colletotrichum spaethianum]
MSPLTQARQPDALLLQLTSFEHSKPLLLPKWAADKQSNALPHHAANLQGQVRFLQSCPAAARRAREPLLEISRK